MLEINGIIYGLTTIKKITQEGLTDLRLYFMDSTDEVITFASELDRDNAWANLIDISLVI